MVAYNKVRKLNVFHRRILAWKAGNPHREHSVSPHSRVESGWPQVSHGGTQQLLLEDKRRNQANIQ